MEYVNKGVCVDFCEWLGLLNIPEILLKTLLE